MTKKEAQLVYMAAQQMSNWLFNVGQGDKMNGTMMLDMVHKWDNVKTPLSKLTTKKKIRKTSQKISRCPYCGEIEPLIGCRCEL